MTVTIEHFTDVVSEADQMSYLRDRLDGIGQDAARKIMGAAVAHDFEGQHVTQLVDEVCCWVRDELRDAGGAEDDVAVLVDHMRRAMIREGKRIAMGLSIEGGHA